jgi:hypothetical protein
MADTMDTTPAEAASGEDAERAAAMDRVILAFATRARNLPTESLAAALMRLDSIHDKHRLHDWSESLGLQDGLYDWAGLPA